MWVWWASQIATQTSVLPWFYMMLRQTKPTQGCGLGNSDRLLNMYVHVPSRLDEQPHSYQPFLEPAASAGACLPLKPSSALFSPLQLISAEPILSDPTHLLSVSMAPKRRRDNTNDDEPERITWISEEIYRGTLFHATHHRPSLLRRAKPVRRLEPQKTIWTPAAQREAFCL